MIILAIDPGLATLGYAYLNVDTNWLTVGRMGVVLNPFTGGNKTESVRARVFALRKALGGHGRGGAFNDMRTCVAIEDLQMFRGIVPTARAAAGFATVVGCLEPDDDIVTVTPTEVKRAIGVPLKLEQSRSKALVAQYMESLPWDSRTPLELLTAAGVERSNMEHGFDAVAIGMTVAVKRGLLMPQRR